MDRPEPGLVKWSPHSSVDSFLHINLQHRVVQLYEPTGHAKNGKFDFEKLSRHDDFPPLTTYDWSPANPGLLAVGTGSGVVNLLKIDDNSNAYVELALKMNRTCQAVAFNMGGLLAVGLDRVRMDQSLHIWDVSRMSSLDGSSSGFPKKTTSIEEPRFKLEPSVSVSSIKFFEDNPQTLVIGIKGQGLRIHDLRDSTSVLNFQTKCNNNLAIDYADSNFFASSALDHPGVMIWDRRATSRPVATHTYLQAVEEGTLPWGGALRLDQVIDTDSNPSFAESKHSFIRSLRYCRDQRGLLAVLSRTGQLKVLETNRESPWVDLTSQHGPELLQVHKSHELDLSYRDSSRKNDRIVSFDWITLPSPVLRPRVLALRANGSFDILETPSSNSDHIHKLVPWKAPHRGLEGDFPYHSMMQFEASQAPQMLGPLLAEEIISHLPIFGEQKGDLAEVVQNASSFTAPASTLLENVNEVQTPLPDSFYRATTAAAKLRSLRDFVREEINRSKSGEEARSHATYSDKEMTESTDLSMALKGTGSCREMHENLLTTLTEAKSLPQEAASVVNHVMLLRAKDKYLLDPVVNRDVVSDDPWVRFLWDWVADAEHAAEDGGLQFSNMDLSYLGVHSIWTNNLGQNPSRRLTSSASLIPETAQWERSIGQYCKKRRLPKFDGVQTKWPHHRQLCLEMCGWGGGQHKHEPGILGDVDAMQDYPSTMHTMIASRALFRGDTKQAIEILKKGSAQHPELLFVSLALQLVGRGGRHASREQLEFDETVATKTDPYLRAISSLIATGDWTAIANQRSLPISDRTYVAVRNLSDDALTRWLQREVDLAKEEGDIEAIALTGITEPLVDVFARYIQKFQDIQTATLILSMCYPRYMDDIRCRAWRNAYRAYLQRHKLFFQRTKFEVESTKRSKRDGIPTLKPPSRQISLRCVFCDAETSLANKHGTPIPASASLEIRNPLMAASINAGVSCPNCGRHLPRCVVCLEVVGIPRGDRPDEKSSGGGLGTSKGNGSGGGGGGSSSKRDESKLAGRFPTFCLKCEHVLHLDHAREWFARHVECPVPECRCRCNSRANPELNYS